MKLNKIIIVILTITLITSCTFKKTDLNPIDLQFVNTTLKTKNEELKSLKGVGNITLKANSVKSSFRLAWALEKPCKLRMVAMAGGQPIESFATNCYYMYILSHNKNHGFYRKRLSNHILESLIKVPVSTNDIITFLSGSIPIKDHDYVELEKKSDGSKIISLFGHWSGIVEKIYLNGNSVSKVSMYSSKKLKYSVSIKHKKSKGYLLPYKLSFVKDSKNSFNLKINRLWPNSKVKSSMFVLTPKD